MAAPQNVLLYGSAGPGQGMTLLTKSDVNNVGATPCRSLYITGAGDLNLVFADGTTAIVTVPANFILPVAVLQLKLTNTTATNVFAIW